MSFEVFQILDNETIDHSITKSYYSKLHHQQGSQLNNSDRKIEFISGENNVYHQIRNAYLQYDIKKRKLRLAAHPPDPVNPTFFDGDAISLMNNAFACTFKKARLRTTEGSNLVHNKNFTQISLIMRLLTGKDRDLISYFDKMKETEEGIPIPSLKQIHMNDHAVDANKR